MLVGIILFGMALYILYMLHKNKYDQLKTSILLFVSLSALFLASYLMFNNFSIELLKRRVTGLILFIIGFWLTFIFPSDQEHQPTEMAHFAIFIGLMIFIGGIWMMFF